MYLTDATYTIRDRLLSTSLWNTIRSNLCNFLHKSAHAPRMPASASSIISIRANPDRNDPGICDSPQNVPAN